MTQVAWQATFEKPCAPATAFQKSLDITPHPDSASITRQNAVQTTRYRLSPIGAREFTPSPFEGEGWDEGRLTIEKP